MLEGPRIVWVRWCGPLVAAAAFVALRDPAELRAPRPAVQPPTPGWPVAAHAEETGGGRRLALNGPLSELVVGGRGPAGPGFSAAATHPSWGVPAVIHG